MIKLKKDFNLTHRKLLDAHSGAKTIIVYSRKEIASGEDYPSAPIHIKIAPYKTRNGWQWVACAWVSKADNDCPEWYGSGTDKSYGYGYDKESHVIARALEKAGLSFKRGYAGTGQTRECILEAWELLGYDPADAFITGL